MNKPQKETIVARINLDLGDYGRILGFSFILYLVAHFVYWGICLKFFKVSSLNVKTGQRLKITSPFVLWLNILRLVGYYIGLSEYKSSKRPIIKRQDLGEGANNNQDQNKNPDQPIFEQFSLEENDHLKNDQIGEIDYLVNDNPDKEEGSEGIFLIKENKVENGNGAQDQPNWENDLDAENNSKPTKMNKKHLKLGTYFGQNLRRFVMVGVGVSIIISFQLLITVILGIGFFPETDNLGQYFLGNFYYKDYLGFVSINCFMFALATFIVSNFMAKKELTNQKVLYREVLKSEMNWENYPKSHKFLSPHVVYFSGLNNHNKYKLEDDLTEYITYLEGSGSVSVNFNTEEQTNKYGGFGKQFRGNRSESEIQNNGFSFDRQLLTKGENEFISSEGCLYFRNIIIGSIILLFGIFTLIAMASYSSQHDH